MFKTSPGKKARRNIQIGAITAEAVDPYIRAFYILTFLLLVTWIVSTCGKKQPHLTAEQQTPAEIALDKAKTLGSNVVATIKDIAQPTTPTGEGLTTTSTGSVNPTGTNGTPIGLMAIETLFMGVAETQPTNTASLNTGNPVDRIVSFLQDPSAEAPQTFILRTLEFESGSSNLTAPSLHTIETLASVIKAYKTMALRLDGHTDNVGNPEQNKRLSAQRALAVLEALVDAGADPGRLSAQGFGEERPIDDNESQAGQRANRRVEVVVLHK